MVHLEKAALCKAGCTCTKLVTVLLQIKPDQTLFGVRYNISIDAMILSPCCAAKEAKVPLRHGRYILLHTANAE